MAQKQIRLLLIKKEVVKGKSKFDTYFTLMNLPEEFGGELHQHSVTVKFRKSVDVSSFGKRGVLTLDPSKDANFPLTYTIGEDEEGNKIYPTVWIRSFQDYQLTSQPREITQSMFVVDEEEETEEVDIL